MCSSDLDSVSLLHIAQDTFHHLRSGFKALRLNVVQSVEGDYLSLLINPAHQFSFYLHLQILICIFAPQTIDQ